MNVCHIYLNFFLELMASVWLYGFGIYQIKGYDYQNTIIEFCLF